MTGFLSRWFAYPPLFFLWLAAYWGHVPVILSHWSSDDYSYCWLVPALAAYLIWDARKALARSQGGAWWPGALCLALAMGLWAVGKAGSLETFVYLSMWLSLAGIALALLGARTARLLAFPFFILLFAIPLPAFLTRLASFRLRLWSSALAAEGMHWLGISVHREGNIIDLGLTQLQVVDACSGLRFLFPTILMALLISRFFLARARTRVALVVVAPFVAVFSNAFRIIITGILVKFVNPKLAEGFFHDFSGWLVYMFSLIILLAIVWALHRFERRAGAAATNEPGDVPDMPDALPAPKLWAPALLSAAMLFGGYLAQHQLVSSQLIPPRTTFKDFPTQIGVWSGERQYLSREVLDSLWADDYVTGHFRNPGTGNVLQLLVSYYATQTTQHTAHAPTACLLGGGWDIKEKQVLQPNSATGRNFPVQRMVMEQAGQRIISNFWFDQRGRHITDEYMNKIYLSWDALTRKRSDGALVRVEMYLLPGQSVEQGQNILDEFIVNLKNILRPYLPNAIA